ncbi:actin binding protein [Aspergillus keveii]|uniref:Actin binding protein n=1 Tax=Aspergillus keveii TaxID=714993 RepID=A0ABR4GEY8_9EURO
MASLNLSANGPSISKSYQSVVDYPVSESARGSPTFAKWAIFSVSTPLVSAFQQDAGSKESVLKVQDTGEGELADLIEEFSEGKIQFAFVKVTDTNTGLPKSVLIAWCGEGVPERTKGYFTSHLSAVSKFLHGYHVQITARSDADLTVEGIVQKVSDASGAKYTPAPDRTPAPGSKPPVSSKPVFTPLRTGGISTTSAAAAKPLPVRVKSNDDDGWGADAPPVTRTNLEKVQSAYQPTKVNIQELKSGKQAEPSRGLEATRTQAGDVVKGGYQPIGKVDIAAIRRQAREAGDFKDDRPETVKGAYEPVGKVDIAAIRAKAQKADIAPPPPKSGPTPSENAFAEPASDQTGRLTTLPKPKVSNRFGGGSAFAGTKPPAPVGSTPKAAPQAPIGSASRTFADQGGKTPAQLWAEKKARERGHEPAAAAVTPSNDLPAAIQSQNSGGGEWKSSYSGKTWAPVQTTHTGKSAQSASNEPTGLVTAETPSPEPPVPQQGVAAIRDQLTQGPPNDAPGFTHAVQPLPSSDGTVDAAVAFEATREQEEQRPRSPSPPPAQPPRSPTPEILERESSPIRVAIPVGRGAADTEEDQIPDPAPKHLQSPQQGFSDERNQDDDIHHAADISAEAITHHDDGVESGKLRALVQYDYEKAEDNEVDLREGEYVTEIDMVDKDWWLGVNARGERGLFPSNYVEIIDQEEQSHVEPDTHAPAANTAAPEPVPEPVPEPASPAESHNKPTAKALYDYEAAEDNELSFPDGAEIKNIEFPDDDWWFGEYRGKTGLFPANYVQLNN